MRHFQQFSNTVQGDKLGDIFLHFCWLKKKRIEERITTPKKVIPADESNRIKSNQFNPLKQDAKVQRSGAGLYM